MACLAGFMPGAGTGGAALAGKGKRLPLPAVRDVSLVYLCRAAAGVAVMSSTDTPGSGGRST